MLVRRPGRIERNHIESMHDSWYALVEGAGERS